MGKSGGRCGPGALLGTGTLAPAVVRHKEQVRVRLGRCRGSGEGELGKMLRLAMPKPLRNAELPGQESGKGRFLKPTPRQR